MENLPNAFHREFWTAWDSCFLPKLFFNLFAAIDTADAMSLPTSAMTVNVNGIPIKANKIQNPRPDCVDGAMSP